MAKKQPRHRVALIVERHTRFGRSILRGINRFVQAGPDWVLHLDEPMFANAELIRRWEPDGLVMQGYANAEPLIGLGLPLVDVANHSRHAVPRVGVDNPAVGRVAAEHLLERGYQRFGYAGRPGAGFAELRCAGYTEHLAAAGYNCAAYTRTPDFGDDTHLTQSWAVDESFRDWILEQPKPFAVFCCNDYWGLQLIEVCRQCRLRVPDDIAILGAGDDDITCELSSPPLSSVSTPGEPIGYEAAVWLACLLEGETSTDDYRLLPPTGVVTRQSTDILAVDDPQVARAIRFIRENADRPLGVADVLDKVPIGRRRLERRFERFLGRTPAQEIRRVHLERAKRLLLESELSIATVAEQSGFTSARKFSEVFRQNLGCTPRDFRRAGREGHAQQ